MFLPFSCLSRCDLSLRSDALTCICAMQSLGVLLFYLCFQTLPFEGDCKLQVSRWLFAAVLTPVARSVIALAVNTWANYMPLM